MAYRFTDTVKWNDTWFCELKPLSKLLFLYLCDQCDIAGFLELNVKKISFDLGTGKQEVERSVKEVSNKLIYSKDKRFIFIKKFLQHQRNLPLKETNKAHIAIINLLNQNLQLFDFTSINQYFDGGSVGDQSPLGNSIGNGDTLEDDKIKDWRDDFQIYLSDVTLAYEKISSNEDFINDRQKYHPNIDIKLSLEKSFKDYWSTEAAWNKRKKSKSKTLDWVSTFRNSLDQKMNQVYKPRQDLFSKQQPASSKENICKWSCEKIGLLREGTYEQFQSDVKRNAPLEVKFLGYVK